MTERWTPQDLAEYVNKNPRALKSNPLSPAKPNKYRNKPTEVNGIRFDSKKEANRYEQLKLMESGGLTKDIQTQVRYRLEVNGIHICDYIADFVYFDKLSKPGRDPWVKIVEDTKGVRTREYKLKKKLMLALYGITIRET